LESLETEDDVELMVGGDSLTLSKNCQAPTHLAAAETHLISLPGQQQRITPHILSMHVISKAILSKDKQHSDFLP
jgi:hypothetical protein